jgi:hypothetical protein
MELYLHFFIHLHGAIKYKVNIFTEGCLYAPCYLKSVKPCEAGVGIATGCELEGPGLIFGSARFFSSSQRPDRLWGPPSLLTNGYRVFFTAGKVVGA